MNKKWFLMLTSTILSAMMLLGCNMNDQDPPPEDDNLGEVEENMEEPLEDPDNDGADENDLDQMEENMEEPFENPDNDAVDENDPNPAD